MTVEGEARGGPHRKSIGLMTCGSSPSPRKMLSSPSCSSRQPGIGANGCWERCHTVTERVRERHTHTHAQTHTHTNTHTHTHTHTHRERERDLHHNGPQLTLGGIMRSEWPGHRRRWMGRDRLEPVLDPLQKLLHAGHSVPIEPSGAALFPCRKCSLLTADLNQTMVRLVQYVYAQTCLDALQVPAPYDIHVTHT